jgi:hypothetical protein
LLEHNVHPVYSTSFGVHVAVITNDCQFIFPQRSKWTAGARQKYVCGAVEGMDDDDHGDPYHCAARGLLEELAITSDENAIRLIVAYIKADTHEAGMGGYIDLRTATDGRRLTFNEVEQRWRSGLARDAIENKLLTCIPFTLRDMADFVLRNQLDMASSAVVVAVSVMQRFFGIEAVEDALTEGNVKSKSIAI